VGEGAPAGPERERIRAAMRSLVAERGYRETTLADLLTRADVDEAAFERHYPDLEACFAEIWEEYVTEFIDVTGLGFYSNEDWREGMRAAAWGFCRFIQADEDRARFFLIEFNYAGEAVHARRDVVMRAYAVLIDRGNEARTAPEPVPRVQADAIIGAIWEGAVIRVLNGEFDQFPAAIPQGLFLTVLPYLGLEAAQEEMRRGPEDIARYERGEL
jgi:AcrR family transcriptional regulator